MRNLPMLRRPVWLAAVTAAAVLAAAHPVLISGSTYPTAQEVAIPARYRILCTVNCNTPLPASFFLRVTLSADDNGGAHGVPPNPVTPRCMKNQRQDRLSPVTLLVGANPGASRG